MVARIQKIKFNGSPVLIKSENRYLPGPNTMRFVWYPIGVMKQVDAPQQMANINGLGSILNSCAAIMAMEVNMIAADLANITAENKTVTRYNIEITTGFWQADKEL